MARKPYQGGVAMFTVGQKVRLVADEGLDTPHEHQGTIGVVTKVHHVNPTTPSYDVTFANGDVAYCEEYHVEEPYEVQVYPDPHDWSTVTIVKVDPDTGNGMPYFVVMAREYADALQVVANKFGVTVEQQRYELSHVDLWGDNGKYFFNYVADGAPGFSVAYGMWALVSVGYPIDPMMDEYFAP